MKGLNWDILKDITDAGFKIIALKLTQISINEAETFYSVHKERPFFNELTSYMSRSPIVAAFLEKDNAVSDLENSLVIQIQARRMRVQLEKDMRFLKAKILFMDQTVMIML